MEQIGRPQEWCPSDRCLDDRAFVRSSTECFSNDCLPSNTCHNQGSDENGDESPTRTSARVDEPGLARPRARAHCIAGNADNVGIGSDLYLNEEWALTLEGAYTIPTNENHELDSVSIVWGILWRFPGAW